MTDQDAYREYLERSAETWSYLVDMFRAREDYEGADHALGESNRRRKQLRELDQS